MTTPSKRLSYANVASTVALIVALGGSGVAVAGALPKNSVGSPQIKNGAVKTSDIKKNAVKGKSVKNNSLTGADIKESTLTGVRSALAAGEITEGTLSAATETRCSLSFDAPSSGQVMILGNISFAGASESLFVDARIYEDGVHKKTQFMDAGDSAGNAVDLAQTIVAVLPVDAGSHVYDLRINEFLDVGSAYSDYKNCQVTGIFSPEA